MSESQKESSLEISDIAAAFSLLSRIPLPVDHAKTGERAAVATWAYPVVGACLGAIAAVAGGFVSWLGAPGGITAAVVLAVLAAQSGAMHEDGLADCADGLGGGSTPEKRLLIMKDSNIGAFGATALMIALIARWAGIESLADFDNLFWPLVAVGAVSRLPMVIAMYAVKNARSDGLSAGVGRAPERSVILAAGIALAIALFSLGWGGIWVIFWAALATLPLFLLAKRLIGGQTGDILGGSQQLAEIAALAAVVALV